MNRYISCNPAVDLLMIDGHHYVNVYCFSDEVLSWDDYYYRLAQEIDQADLSLYRQVSKFSIIIKNPSKELIILLELKGHLLRNVSSDQLSISVRNQLTGYCAMLFLYKKFIKWITA